MQLILSRKGFDSGYGGMPSPILPDGSLIPLPIPAAHDRHTLADLNFPGVDIEGLIADLSKGRHRLSTTVHLDPDLNRAPAKRLPGWRPALGQTGNAQSHLRDMGVGVGDVFLFFGWFRETSLNRGKWRYRPGAPNLHVVFGWIEIADVLPVAKERRRCLQAFPWIADHPHVLLPTHYDDPRNTLYVAAESSRYLRGPCRGGGRFFKYSDKLRLTKDGASRSVWSLPGWFMPRDGRPPLSYHRSTTRWQREGTRVVLRSAAKGQEFVLDCGAYPESGPWIADTIRTGTAT